MDRVVEELWKELPINDVFHVFIHCAIWSADWGPVHTYPDIFESATFSFRKRLPSTRIRRIRWRIQKKYINPLCRVDKNKSATNAITCGRVSPDIFVSDDVKSVSSFSPNNKSIWRQNVEGEQSKFPATRELKHRRFWATDVNRKSTFLLFDAYYFLFVENIKL